jgi:hypothetical protein
MQRMTRSMFFALVAAALVSGSARADLIYDNGPTNGTYTAWTINSGYSVSDSFSVSQASTLSSAQIGLWATKGDTPSSVTWTISTKPLGAGTVLASGTSSLSSTLLNTNKYGLSVFNSTFGINSTLGAGKYYLTLSNGVSNGDPLYWDQDGGKSVAYSSGTTPSKLNGNSYTFGGINVTGGSEAFQLFGSAVTPEPATIAVLGGMMVAGRVYVRRRKLLVAA